MPADRPAPRLRARVLAAALAVAALACTPSARAECQFRTSPGAIDKATTPLNFGELPIGSDNDATVTVSGNPSIRALQLTGCPYDSGYAITAVGGNARTLTNSRSISLTIPYTLDISTSGPYVTVKATIYSRDFNNAAAGSYSDKVILNLTP